MAKTSLRKPLGVLANGVDGQVVLSWESVQGADGYEVFEKAEEENVFLKLRATKQCKLVFKNKKRGSVYQYKVEHIKYTRRMAKRSVSIVLLGRLPEQR